jgi:predicted CoA-substrate-specific enzyme activase
MPAIETIVATAGVDVGTEYVKAVVIAGDGKVLGRAAVPTRGYFQDRAYEALGTALEDARLGEADLAAVAATGFAADRVSHATLQPGEAACHALGAFHILQEPMTLIVLGGHEPQVIRVGQDGAPRAVHRVRRCAVGVGSFLMFVARHLDVHPTRLQELASAAGQPAELSSYCSIFSSTGMLERLRDGASREEVAQGAIQSIAARVVELGDLEPPVRACGGVTELFPGVLRAIEALTGHEVTAVPDPICTAALGAALMARPQ